MLDFTLHNNQNYFLLFLSLKNERLKLIKKTINTVYYTTFFQECATIIKYFPEKHEKIRHKKGQEANLGATQIL